MGEAISAKFGTTQHQALRKFISVNLPLTTMQPFKLIGLQIQLQKQKYFIIAWSKSAKKQLRQFAATSKWTQQRQQLVQLQQLSFQPDVAELKMVNLKPSLARLWTVSK